MAAYGSGAVSRAIRDATPVMNVDIGGGTSKIAVCADGKVIDLTAVDVGARLVVTDEQGRVTRVEEAGRQFGAELGLKLELGAVLKPDDARALAARMTDRLFEAMKGGSPKVGSSSLLRLDALHACARDFRSDDLGRRVRICLWPREDELRRSRADARGRNPRAHPELGQEAGQAGRRHPRHRDRRVAIHDAGERQHDLCLADGRDPGAQRARDRARHEPGRRRDRCRDGRGRDQGGARGVSISATASGRWRCSRRGAARRRSRGSMRSAAA